MTADLYSKPTDKHQYLSPSSCHPKQFHWLLKTHSLLFCHYIPVSSNDGVNLLVFAWWFQQWSIFVLP
jgi:hypothetical protein